MLLVQLKQSPFLTNLQAQRFHKLIIGAALKDYKTIEDYACVFTHAGADVIDISAFPHSVISAKKGIEQAVIQDSNLIEPLIMISVNIGEDPHFRRIVLNEETCTECLACVPSCPSLAFGSLNAKDFSYNENLCFGCSACLPTCNFDALSFTNWNSFEPQSLNELKELGANAIEIHLNNDLQAFAEFYRSMETEFALESFCIGSGQMNASQLILAATRIIEEVERKHGPDKVFIIQCDGSPMSGAHDTNPEKDSPSIHSAQSILEFIAKNYPERKNIFVQLAGGIDEHSLAKAFARNVQVNGVAIGSYARKKLAELDSEEERIKIAKAMVQPLRESGRQTR